MTQAHARTILKPDFALVAPQIVQRFDAIDLLKSVVRADEIQLAGFCEASARKGAWTHPMVPFVAAASAEEERLAHEATVSRWRLLFMVVALGSALLVGASVGAYLSAMKLNVLDKAISSAAPWKVVDLRSDGVIISSDARQLLVPVGEALPNGELVLSVLPDKRAVVLGSGTLVLRPNPGPAGPIGKQP